MFARMTILQVVPESADEAIRLFRRSVVPEAKKQRGYRGACLLTNATTGKAIVVTFWRREADALANEKSRYYQEQLVKFLQYFSGPPMREGYAVRVHALSAAPRRKPGLRPRPSPAARRGGEGGNGATDGRGTLRRGLD
jgi:heme-degrading monooxygenase HmoA